MRRYPAQVDCAGTTSLSRRAATPAGDYLLLSMFVKSLIPSKRQSMFQKIFYIFYIHIQGEHGERECTEPFINYLYFSQYVVDNDNNNGP